MNRGPIHLQIDELVLEGFNPAERHRIADAVQQELTRRWSEQPLPAVSGPTRRVDHLESTSFVVSSGNARDVGRQIAQSLSGAVLGALVAPASATSEGRAR